MKQKFIEIIYEAPPMPQVQRFAADNFKVAWEGGVMKLRELTGGQVVLMLSSEKVHGIRFGEEEVESPILRPSFAPPKVDVGPAGIKVT